MSETSGPVQRGRFRPGGVGQVFGGTAEWVNSESANSLIGCRVLLKVGDRTSMGRVVAILDDTFSVVWNDGRRSIEGTKNFTIVVRPSNAPSSYRGLSSVNGGQRKSERRSADQGMQHTPRIR